MVSIDLNENDKDCKTLKMTKRTSVQLYSDTKERLAKETRHKGETFDQIINRLLDENKKKCKTDKETGAMIRNEAENEQKRKKG